MKCELNYRLIAAKPEVHLSVSLVQKMLSSARAATFLGQTGQKTTPSGQSRTAMTVEERASSERDVYYIFHLLTSKVSFWVPRKL